MALVSKATRERIRERIDMVQLVSEYVVGGLQARGQDDHWGRCPFHEEKSASFHIRPSKGVYKCFGCAKGGDVFRFVEEVEGVDFKEALKRLARRTGVELEAETPEERAREERRAALLHACNQAVEFYESVLWSRTPAGEKGRAALKKRGITEETARAWRLGVAPDGWDALQSAMRARKVPERALLELGLIRRKDGGAPGSNAGSSGGRPYDFFRDRLMIPIACDQGRHVAFGGRTLADDPRKYMNSPEVPGLFEKRKVLFGLDKAKKARARRLVVVEGYMDVIVPHQAGLTEFVATLGTALTPEQARLGRRLADEIVLLFDGDAAGQAATQKALAGLVGEQGLTLRVARLPDGVDPDELVLKDKAGLEKVLAEADDLVGFLMTEALRGWDASSPAGRERSIKAAIKLLGRIDDRIGVATQMNRLAERFGLPETLLRDEVARARNDALGEARAEADRARRGETRQAAPAAKAPAAKASRAPLKLDAETALLEGLLAVADGVARVTARGVAPALFSEGPARLLAEAIFAAAAEGPVDAAGVLGRLEEPAARDLAAALVGRIDPSKNYAADLDGADGLLLRARRRRLQDVNREIRRTKDEARRTVLLEESKRLGAEIRDAERSRTIARAR